MNAILGIKLKLYVIQAVIYLQAMLLTIHYY